MKSIKEIKEQNKREFEEGFTEMLNQSFKEYDSVETFCLERLIKSFLSSAEDRVIEAVREKIKGLMTSVENKCAKCGAILSSNWLPPICPTCFYSKDENKWDGVKDKETSDQRTLGYNAALSDLLTYLES